MSMAPSGDAAIKSFTAPGDVFACVESPLGDGVTTFTSEAIEPPRRRTGRVCVDRIVGSTSHRVAAGDDDCFRISCAREDTTRARLADADCRAVIWEFRRIRANACSTDSTYPSHSDLLPERMTGKQAIFDYWKGAPEMFDSIVEMRVAMGR
jgi:hypothetical protein